MLNKVMDNLLFIILLILMGILLFFVSNQAMAGNFNYGKDTYEKVDDILIVNSLGDETNISTFGKLGTNDYIPENAFKNLLTYEGYSIAYDYNPLYNGYYSEFYNVKLPDEDLTKITIAGLAGNPQAMQDVYVLTKEYNQLSAIGQANSINNLNNNLNIETDNRIIGNNILQTNINNEINQRIINDNQLDDKIVNNDLKQTSWNTTQDKNINNLSQENVKQNNTLNKHSEQINDLDNRVSKLEKTQYKLQTEFRILDTKKVTISPYFSQNFTRNKVDEVGIKVTVKLGKSYEEKEIEKTNKRLERLEQNIGQTPIIEKIVDEKGKTISTSITQNGFKMEGVF